MRILIVGAGAVGVYYGSKLAQAGAEVSTVTRSDYEIIKKEGYQIQSVKGTETFQPASVFSSVEEAGRDWDIVMVALKALPETDPIPMLHKVLGPRTAILLLQNGIGIEAPIAKIFPFHELIGGLAFICVFRHGPNKIEHLDYGNIMLGNWPFGISETVQTLTHLFQTSGIKCTAVEDVIKARWKKLCWNAPFNPLSVLAGKVDTAYLVSNPAIRKTITGIMREIQALSIADGHGFSDDHIESQLQATDNMKPYRPSMLLDFEAKRPMEVEAILGNAVRFGEEKGVDVPRLSMLYALLKIVDEQNRREE